MYTHAALSLFRFTVRHLAGVFQGLLMSAPDVVNTPAKWGKLWLHESERVYADRLVSLQVRQHAHIPRVPSMGF
jgi:AAA+ lid domain